MKSTEFRRKSPRLHIDRLPCSAEERFDRHLRNDRFWSLVLCLFTPAGIVLLVIGICSLVRIVTTIAGGH